MNSTCQAPKPLRCQSLMRKESVQSQRRLKGMSALEHHPTILSPGSKMPITSIYVVGPSSTGKSTLCEGLFKHITVESQSQPRGSDGQSVLLHTISEVARKVMRERQFTRDDVGTVEMQQSILEAQVQAERDGLAFLASSDSTREKVLLSDRCAIDALVYTRKFVSEDAYKTLCETPGFQEARRRYRGERAKGKDSARVLVILTLPVAEWLTDDGVRNMDEPGVVLEEFRWVLNDLEVPFVELGDSIMELGRRVEWVVSKACLDTPMSNSNGAVSHRPQ
jgi:GTPase SAR1 family protein